MHYLYNIYSYTNILPKTKHKNTFPPLLKYNYNNNNNNNNNKLKTGPSDAFNRGVECI